MTIFATNIENAREHYGAWILRAVAMSMLALLFFVAGGGVSHNGKWQISRVDIVGANTVSVDAMRSLVQEKLLGNYFFVYARDNSYLFPRQEVEQTLLDTFPRLNAVSVDRVDMHTIAVAVSERKPYALWCGDEFHAEAPDAADCWFIDDTGFVFDTAPVFSEGVYLKMYGMLNEETSGNPLRGAIPLLRFATVDALAKLVRAEFGELVRVEMKAGGEDEVVIHTSTAHLFLAGVAVRFKDEHDPMILMNNLRASIPVQFPDNVALGKKLLYIDTRFGNKIFFGFEN